MEALKPPLLRPVFKASKKTYEGSTTLSASKSNTYGILSLDATSSSWQTKRKRDVTSIGTPSKALHRCHLSVAVHMAEEARDHENSAHRCSFSPTTALALRTPVRMPWTLHRSSTTLSQQPTNKRHQTIIHSISVARTQLRLQLPITTTAIRSHISIIAVAHRPTQREGTKLPWSWGREQQKQQGIGEI